MDGMPSERHESNLIVSAVGNNAPPSLSAIYRQIADFYDEALLLEEISKLSYTDPFAAIDALNGLKRSGHFSFLETAVITLISNHIRCGEYREKDIRKLFYDNLSEYIPGAIKISAQLIRGNIPDGFIAVSGREIPVEIKRKAFDSKALNQLQRYMKVYDSETGVAVAPKLVCSLPSNVRFVEVRPVQRKGLAYIQRRYSEAA